MLIDLGNLKCFLMGKKSQLFDACSIQFSEFGFPLTAFDLGVIVKTYL